MGVAMAVLVREAMAAAGTNPIPAISLSNLCAANLRAIVTPRRPWPIRAP